MSNMRPQDRRRHPRVPAEALSFLSVQMAGGARVRLLDVSHGGVRLETAQHMRRGQTLSVRFSINDEVMTVGASVVRATVSSLEADRVLYETALQLLDDTDREQFQLALASGGRARDAADGGDATGPGVDVVLITDASADAPRDWWLARPAHADADAQRLPDC